MKFFTKFDLFLQILEQYASSKSKYPIKGNLTQKNRSQDYP